MTITLQDCAQHFKLIIAILLFTGAVGVGWTQIEENTTDIATLKDQIGQITVDVAVSLEILKELKSKLDECDVPPARSVVNESVFESSSAKLNSKS